VAKVEQLIALLDVLETQLIASLATAAKVDLARIRAYLNALATDAGDFFDYLKASLQP
jgi:hypothetical protein